MISRYDRPASGVLRALTLFAGLQGIRGPPSQ